MKSKIKKTLYQYVPTFLSSYQAIRNRHRFSARFSALHGEVRQLLYGDAAIIVLSGPFKGLKYFSEIVWGPITPKWLGSYEVELSHVIELIVAKEYGTVIDIGCAEGYYATGLAYRMPSAQVFAYDVDFLARSQARRLARLNSLDDRVHVDGFCSGAEISRRVKGNTLIVCDIEGFERELLDPKTCPSLSSTDILVEVHENAPGINTLNLLIGRFCSTHVITQVASCARDGWLDNALASGIVKSSEGDVLKRAVNEHRSSAQQWLWLSRKSEIST